jgi:transposase
VVEDLQSSLPNSVRVILKLLVDTLTALEAQITALDAEINQRSKSDPTARRLMTIPGVGPIASTAVTALVPAAEGFPAGRDFAAWLGLTPLQKSTGGKQKLGAVSKRGERTDEFIRRFLLHTLPDGFHRIRHYGYLSNGQRAAKLADCRRLLAVPVPAPLGPAADYRERYEQLTGRSLDLCPGCGGRMIEIGVIPRASTFAAAAPWNTS